VTAPLLFGTRKERSSTEHAPYPEALSRVHLFLEVMSPINSRYPRGPFIAEARGSTVTRVSLINLIENLFPRSALEESKKLICAPKSTRAVRWRAWITACPMSSILVRGRNEFRRRHDTYRVIRGLLNPGLGLGRRAADVN